MMVKQLFPIIKMNKRLKTQIIIELIFNFT